MKIALCFAGFLRSLPFTISNWAYRLKHVDYDTFIYSPNTYYTNELEFETNKEYVNMDIIKNLKNVKECILYEYNSQKFKDVLINHNIEEHNFIGQKHYRILSYQYNIQECMKLVHGNYDLIIMTRADITLYDYFNFNNLDLSSINYPTFHGLHLNGDLKPGAAKVFDTDKAFNDQIFCGAPDKMNIYKNIYDSIPNYFNKIKINSETILGYHAMQHNVNFHDSDFIKYDLLRVAR